ncbi:MAG: hypothetical protein WBA45_10025 [Microthrixaceae bacterium]
MPTTPPNMPNAEALLEIVDSFPSPTAVGFEPDGDGLNLHVKHLAADDRSGSADLFGFHAPASWQAIGITMSGTAVPLDSLPHLPDALLDGDDLVDLDLDDDGADDVSYSIVLSRNGEFASRLQIDGELIQNSWPSADFPDTPKGVSVDTLHRVMGLQSPGEEPPIELLKLSMWLDSIMEIIASRGKVTWREAAALQSAFNEPSRVDPSVESVAEAIVRSSTSISWERLRSRSCLGSEEVMGLSTDELSWMDATMYARWIMSYQPDLDLVVATLVAAGTGDVGRKITEVIDAVSERCDEIDDPFYTTRTA